MLFDCKLYSLVVVLLLLGRDPWARKIRSLRVVLRSKLATIDLNRPIETRSNHRKEWRYVIIRRRAQMSPRKKLITDYKY